MKQVLIAYHDKKMNYFLPVASIHEADDESIVEEVKRLVCSDACPKRYLEYDLYRLGVYDDKTGIITSYSPEFIVSLGDFRALKEELTDVQG